MAAENSTVSSAKEPTLNGGVRGLPVHRGVLKLAGAVTSCMSSLLGTGCGGGVGSMPLRPALFPAVLPVHPPCTTSRAC